MSYPETPVLPENAIGTPQAETILADYLSDLGDRKEFRSVLSRPKSAADYLSRLSDAPEDGALSDIDYLRISAIIPGLRLHGAQIFVSNFSTPNTPNTRLLLNWQTGVGKSIAMIAITLEYDRQFRLRHTTLPADRPTIFVLASPGIRQIIQSEMLRHPEFGFVSREEVAEARRLQVRAGAEARQLSGYLGVLKRRITDRTRGGYYQFYGYEEFANRLFVTTRRGRARKFDMKKLYERSQTAGDEFLDRLEEEIRAGNVQVDRELLDSLRGGFLAADEIQNVYNIQRKNNYGIAIQYVLDTLGDEAPRALFMSATPLTGSATEAVDLTNLLVPRSHLPRGRALRKEDFFEMGRAEPGRVSVALPGAEERLGQLSAGRISFVLDTDPATYPRRIFDGGSLATSRYAGGIPYLRFTPTPMAPLHERTVKAALGLGGTEKDGRPTIASNARTLLDMVYPNPDAGGGDPWKALDDPAATGLYLSGETAARLTSATSDWLAAAGLLVQKGPGVYFSGPFLELGANVGAKTPPSGTPPSGTPPSGTPPGLEHYSSKYAAIVRDVIERIRSGPGKIMIYHHRVRMSGVLQLQEALLANGIIDEFSNPTDDTLCGICGVDRKSHAGTATGPATGPATPHDYMPARFVVAHYYVERAAMNHSIELFNAAENSGGALFRVIIGSGIIGEGYTIKAVRLQCIAGVPLNIPTLIQVFGRVGRKFSHADLPPDQRDVTFRIYVSTWAGTPPAAFADAPEVFRYSEKMAEYLVIQRIMQAYHRWSIDGWAMRDRLSDEATLEALPVKPAVRPSEGAPTTATFDAYGHGDAEVRTAEAVLRALFTARPVWTYGDLRAASIGPVSPGLVRGLHIDPTTIAEGSLVLALQNLMRPEAASVGVPRAVVRVPATDGGSAPDNAHSTPDYYILADIGPDGRPIIDIDLYVRTAPGRGPTRVRVGDYVREARTTKNFAVRLSRFEGRYSGAQAEPIEHALTDHDADFHYTLLRTLVESQWERGTAESAFRRRAKTHGSAIFRIANLYRRFKVVLTADDFPPTILRAGATAKGRQAFVGYAARKVIKAYNPGATNAASAWYDVPREVIGYLPRQKENDVVVGYATATHGNVRFKIRPPLHELERAKVRDIRSLARGATCETRPRAEQECLACKLKAAPKSDLRRMSAVEICGAIRDRLLEREEAVRAQPKGIQSGIRWFYLFNDPLPVITLLKRGAQPAAEAEPRAGPRAESEAESKAESEAESESESETESEVGLDNG